MCVVYTINEGRRGGLHCTSRDDGHGWKALSTTAAGSVVWVMVVPVWRAVYILLFVLCEA